MRKLQLRPDIQAGIHIKSGEVPHSTTCPVSMRPPWLQLPKSKPFQYNPNPGIWKMGKQSAFKISTQKKAGRI